MINNEKIIKVVNFVDLYVTVKKIFKILKDPVKNTFKVVLL